MPSSHMAVLFVPLLASCEASPEKRVERARATRMPEIGAKFAAAGVDYPPGEIYLRAFKSEGELELWAGARGQPLSLIHTYAICASSGDLGPKRREGDGQVPEGFYFVDRFNPRSAFHLSLGIDYPNKADRQRARGAVMRLGGDIFIHGSCTTVGCIPIRDAAIEELYLVALEARVGGQKEIPVHIFPARLDPAGLARLLEKERPAPDLTQFWTDLSSGFIQFERTHRPPRVTVRGESGRYVVSN